MSRYSPAATLDRVRAACSPYSTIDVEQHAEHVADDAMRAREHARAELLRLAIAVRRER